MSNITENPRGGCVLAGINSTLSAISRICPIYHSGPGCCMQTTNANQTQSGGKVSGFLNNVALPCTNMLEKDVVFGAADKLRTTVQGSIDVIDADAYFILTGCTAGIIGEDVEEVAEEFRDKGYPVYAIETPGFYGDDLYGYEITWKNFINQVIEPQEKDPKLVNLFGIVPYRDPFWSGNLEEISRILKRLGLRVNTFYTEHQGFDTIRTCSAAALNIIISPWLFWTPAKMFEEKFGVPSLRFPFLPVGATDTTAFVRQVAEALSLDPKLTDSVIASEEDYVYSYLEQAIGRLSWKKFAVVGDTSPVVGITRYLANDYSFTPDYDIITTPIWFKETAETVRQKLTSLEYAEAPEIYFSADQFRTNEIIRKHPDTTLIVGSTNDREAASYVSAQFLEATFPVDNRLFFNRAVAGYRGSLTLTEDLYDNL